MLQLKLRIHCFKAYKILFYSCTYLIDKITFNCPVRPAGLSGTTFLTNIPNIVSVEGDSELYKST